MTRKTAPSAAAAASAIGPLTQIAVLFAVLAALLTSAGPPASAQPSLERPRTSPQAGVQQKIGVTNIEVSYHRPGVKGREIWGALVPWNQVWRTGANEVTTVSFSDPVTLEGREVAAGTYGFFTIPRPDRWTVILSSNTTVWGTDYDSTRDLLRVEVTPAASRETEWMEFGFSGLSDTGGVLELRWEKLVVPVRLAVNTPGIVLGNARKEFAAGPDTGRWQMLRQAAGYALSRGTALDEALSWIDRSLAVRRNPASLVLKSDLLAATGDAAGSTRLLDSAVAAAKEEEILNVALNLRRDGRGPRAVEVLERYAARKNGSWALTQSLGESYDAAGDRGKALAHLNEALKLAPEEPARKEIRALIRAIEERKGRN